MWRISNDARRAFIVKATSVLKGGEKIAGTGDISINPGMTVEVVDSCGEYLSTYHQEIKVISRPKQAGNKKGEANAVESAGNK